MNYIEQVYFQTDKFPSAQQVCKALALSEKEYNAAMRSKDFKQMLSDRGLVMRDSGDGILTPEQLACANTLLDFADTRSRKKKLSDLGITSQQYQAWLKDPAFQAYCRKRAEDLLPDSMHEVHGALLDTAMRGDVSAMKLYYEMTGRYNPRQDATVDVQFLLVRVIEAIQKHVTDPAALTAIAEEISAYQGVAQPVLSQTPVAKSLPVAIQSDSI